jgi:hypothetical protein
MPRVTKNATLRLDPDVASILHAHAWRLDVRDSELTRDILRAWAATVTDWKDPIFDPKRTGITPLPLPKNRYPGYLAALGFVEGSLAPVPDPLSPHRKDDARYGTPDHTNANPQTEADVEFTVDTEELRRLARYTPAKKEK